MINYTIHFLSCDWGTFSFRLCLVRVEGFKILAEEKSKDGSAATFKRWQQVAQPIENRIEYYLKVLESQIDNLKKKVTVCIDEVPLIISGMASSTIGVMELPYKKLPFFIDGSDLHVKKIPATSKFIYDTILISGVRTDEDVMRDEETQLVGCDLPASDHEQLFIHPGTHSKYVAVRDGKGVSLKTYMTDDFFSLLATKCILTQSIKNDGDFNTGAHKKYFEMGVKKGSTLNLLHEAFMVRTNNLFNKLTSEQNYFFFSGLLIGNELKDIFQNFNGGITLAGEPDLIMYYTAALNYLSIAKNTPSFLSRTGVETTLKR
ncbi:MAG: 2-dehydro-3-deoxygalactonokinase [Flavobacterium sp.]|nr:2-dehydro-3-deoxygalactonokinase [Pedobacter sp.]